MKSPIRSVVLTAGLAGAPALAQNAAGYDPGLHGLTRDGRILHIDDRSGAVTPIGSVGIPCVDAARGMACRMLGLASDGRILQIDARSGRLLRIVEMIGLPPGAEPVAIGLDDAFLHTRTASRVYILAAEPLIGDVLYSADLARGVYTLVGPTGQRGLRGMDGYLAIAADRSLFTLSLGTGEAEPVKTVGPPHAGGFEDVIGVYAANAGLWRLVYDPPEMRWQQVSERGLEDVVGLALVDPIYYADCDTSTGPNSLDVFDFLMFMNRYDLGDSHACDCNTETGLGVCDIFDFTCYQNAWSRVCP